jgi:hypothetical protein
MQGGGHLCEPCCSFLSLGVRVLVSPPATVALGAVGSKGAALALAAKLAVRLARTSGRDLAKRKCVRASHYIKPALRTSLEDGVDFGGGSMAKSTAATVKTDERDRALLNAKANEFAQEILGLNLPHVRPIRPLSSEPWDRTDGWWVQIATFRGLSIGISIDWALRPHVRPAPASRTFWYGFWTYDQKRILRLSSSMLPRFQSRILANDQFRDDTPVKTVHLRYPVLETATSEKYFGMYDCEKLLHVPRVNIRKAVKFVRTAVLSYEEAISRNARRKTSSRSASKAYSRFSNARAEKIDPKHTKLQNRFEAYVKDHLEGTEVTSDQAGVDVQYRANGQLVLTEVKPSCTRNEIRLAMGQLFDYEQDCDDKNAWLLIVLGHKPTRKDALLATSNRCGIAYPRGRRFAIKFAKR